MPSWMTVTKQSIGIGRIRHHSFWALIFLLFSILPIFFAVNQLFRLRLFDVTLIDNAYMYFLLGFYLPVVFLIYPATPSAPKDRIPWYDALLFGVTALICFYFGLNGLKIVGLGWEYAAPFAPTLLSLLLWALVIEAVRRSADLSLMVTCLIFSLYPIFAYHLPGFLKGQSFDLLTAARLHAMGANGIIGLPFFVLANLLIGFILFGIILQNSGGGAFFYNLASSLLGQYRGGAAKIGILGSSFFGMLSGSTVSNVVAIGSMTIPAMKRTGFSAHYAAAIESCASAGGPIMPPVMGAAAFIMASFLNVPYYQIAIAAAIPACLYYLGLFIQVDGYAAKTGLKGIPRNELPPLWGTLKQGWFYLGVIVIMCYFLLSLTVEAWAPFYASGALLILNPGQEGNTPDMGFDGSDAERHHEIAVATGGDPERGWIADRRPDRDRCRPFFFPRAGCVGRKQFSPDSYCRGIDKFCIGVGNAHDGLLYLSGRGYGAGPRIAQDRSPRGPPVCILLGGSVGYHSADRALRGRCFRDRGVQLHADRMDGHEAGVHQIPRSFLLCLQCGPVDPWTALGSPAVDPLCRDWSLLPQLRTGRIPLGPGDTQPHLSYPDYCRRAFDRFS